jgi:SAM-dependent methyltransferase
MQDSQKERDYVWGTHDDEVVRLGLQHRVWRPRTTDAWRRAGFTTGQTLIDLGCGPGYAALDLAEIVGPTGKVIAIDRSRRFLDALDEMRRQRGLTSIEAVELDLEEQSFPNVHADGAWGWWVFAFLKQPKAVLQRTLRALKPGAAIVLFEYLHYTSWKFSPRSPEMEEFTRIVVETLHAAGGEADVGADLPRWLVEFGCEIRSLNPIVDVVSRDNYIWQWPKSWIEVGLQRFIDIGALTSKGAEEILRAFQQLEASPDTLMITPTMVEIIGVRP